MTKSAVIRARMDPHLKEEVDIILQELGISTTQALTLYYQQIRLNRGIPFEIRIPNRDDKPEEHSSENRSAGPFPIDEQREDMEQNVEAYRNMHSELVECYLEEYVAIHQGQLIDHDPDPVALLQRVREKYADRVVLRRKVESVPEREVRIRHPRIEPAP